MPVPSATWVGLKLEKGRYRVTSRLGAGGMGEVYLAEDTKLDCRVVIKVPHPHLLETPDVAGRFRREVRALIKLSHAHIVRVMDLGECRGLPFVVMQYLPGGDLRGRLR